MKIKTSLKQSMVAAKLATVLCLIALWLAIKFPNWITILCLTFSAFFLMGDIVNIIRIKRKAAKDASYLDEKIN